MYALRTMGQFTYSKCKVASMLWFAHFGIRIGAGAQLMSCPHTLDHTSILLIFEGKLDGQKPVLGDKTRHFLVHHFLHLL